MEFEYKKLLVLENKKKSKTIFRDRKKLPRISMLLNELWHMHSEKERIDQVLSVIPLDLQS